MTAVWVAALLMSHLVVLGIGARVGRHRGFGKGVAAGTRLTENAHHYPPSTSPARPVRRRFWSRLDRQPEPEPLVTHARPANPYSSR